MDIPWLHQFPLWVSAVLFLVVFSLALESGLRAGLRQHRSREDGGKTEQGDLTLNSLLILLALMLALTFSFSLSRADLRKQAVLNEANAIGTAFYRADLAAEPARTELRERLLAYARTRLYKAEEGYLTSQQLQQQIAHSLEAQAKLWPATVRVLEGDLPAPIQASIVQAINEVLDAHTTRITFAFDRQPWIVMVLLLFISAASLGVVGYNVALVGGLYRWRMSIFTLVLAAIILVISDFDRPGSGFIQVSNQSLIALVEDMESALGE
jgi:hypothetical protein